MRIAAFLWALCAFAGDAPTITADMRARFWRTQAEAVQARNVADKAAAVAQAVQADLAKTCEAGGLQFAPDQFGEPACVAKGSK